MIPVVSPDLELQEIGVSESLFHSLQGRKVSVIGVGSESQNLLFTPKILPLSPYAVAFGSFPSLMLEIEKQTSGSAAIAARTSGVALSKSSSHSRPKSSNVTPSRSSMHC